MRDTALRECSEEIGLIPEDVEINAYTLDEIFIEKCLCILNPSRSEPRDVFDLWFLTINKYVDYDFLVDNIKEKGQYKGLKNFNLLQIFAKKRHNYSSLWENRLEQQMVKLPHFEKVYRELKRELKQLNILLKE